MVLLKYLLSLLKDLNIIYLHSTMVLLKLDVEYEDIRGGTKSTFHYGSIKIIARLR